MFSTGQRTGQALSGVPGELEERTRWLGGGCRTAAPTPTSRGRVSGLPGACASFLAPACFAVSPYCSLPLHTLSFALLLLLPGCLSCALTLGWRSVLQHSALGVFPRKASRSLETSPASALSMPHENFPCLLSRWIGSSLRTEVSVTYYVVPPSSWQEEATTGNEGLPCSRC